MLVNTNTVNTPRSFKLWRGDFSSFVVDTLAPATSTVFQTDGASCTAANYFHYHQWISTLKKPQTFLYAKLRNITHVQCHTFATLVRIFRRRQRKGLV